MIALVVAAATPGNSAEVPFKKVQLFFEYNATAGDGGLQAFFDADAWKRVKIVGPDRRVVFEVAARRGLQKVGLTELRFESDEPSLAEILARFPAGKYEFEGSTVGGDELEGTAMLSHDIPDPAVISPVDPTNPVIAWTWNPSPGSPIQTLASFQVIVENDRVSMTIDLAPSKTSLKVPPEFLQAGTEYKFEVLAIAANLNRTITEGTFVTP